MRHNRWILFLIGIISGWLNAKTLPSQQLIQKKIESSKYETRVYSPISLQIRDIYTQLGKISVQQALHVQGVQSQHLELNQALKNTYQLIKENKWNQALKKFSKSCQLYVNHHSCLQDQCTKFSIDIQNLISWSYQYKKEHAQKITELYQRYLLYFPLDLHITNHAAQWTLGLKKYSQSMDFYERYILFSKRYISQSIKGEYQKKYHYKMLESVFYLYYQIAQLSKDFNLEVRSYDFYLKHTIARQFLIKVQFLKSVALFNLKHYSTVAPIFRLIALSQYEDVDVRQKSAEYALRALKKLDKPVVIQKWAENFGMIFPKKTDLFQEIVKKIK